MWCDFLCRLERELERDRDRLEELDLERERDLDRELARELGGEGFGDGLGVVPLGARAAIMKESKEQEKTRKSNEYRYSGHS